MKIGWLEHILWPKHEICLLYQLVGKGLMSLMILNVPHQELLYRLILSLSHLPKLSVASNTPVHFITVWNNYMSSLQRGQYNFPKYQARLHKVPCDLKLLWNSFFLDLVSILDSYKMMSNIFPIGKRSNRIILVKN
jgi:hypothetical protein